MGETAEEKRETPRAGLFAGGRAVLAVLLALAVAAGAAGGLYLADDMSIAAFAETIRSWGMWGIAGSIGLMVLHSFIPFPAEILAFANGILFGVFWGTVVTWIGAMLGASVAFGLARRFGRPLVERMVTEKHWQTVDRWAGRNGWQAVLVGRFIPVIAFNLINYAAGLTRISWWQFLWTTGVGILPMTLVMVVMGDSMEHFGWKSWAALSAAGVGLWLLLHWIGRRRR